MREKYLVKGKMMTSFYQKKSRCCLCRSTNEYVHVGSTNTLGGFPDLDTRPPQMARATISEWVHRCPNCGYCAPDVSIIYHGSRPAVNSKEYKDQLNDPTYPELANSFLCQAIVNRESRDFAAATWALIHAAWVCDDSGHTEQAKVCRQKAADMLLIAEDKGHSLSKQEGSSTAILIDLLRRSGQTEQAQKMIKARRGNITNEIIARVLDFETILLDKNDMSCYTIAEIP